MTDYIDSLLVRSNAKITEKLAAYIINSTYLLSSNLIVGDDPNQKLPDIFTDDHTLGIEVTECEYSRDFKKRKIYNFINEKGGDYDETIAYIKKHFPNDNFYPSSISDPTTNSGKRVYSVSGTRYSHRRDWMKEEYIENCANKSKKLNEGNYSGISKSISLCVVMLERSQAIYDAELVLWSYLNHLEPNQKKFDNLFVINYTSLIVFKLSNIERIDANVTENNTIIDFQITGTDYVNIIKYNYHEIITRLLNNDDDSSNSSKT